MCVEVGLEVDENVSTGMVDEDAATAVHVFWFCFAFGRVEASFCCACKVVGGDALTGKKVVVFQDPVSVRHFCCLLPRSMSEFLFAVKASRTERWTRQFTDCCVQSTCLFCMRQYTSLHQELNGSETCVSQTLVPS